MRTYLFEIATVYPTDTWEFQNIKLNEAKDALAGRVHDMIAGRALTASRVRSVWPPPRDHALDTYLVHKGVRMRHSVQEVQTPTPKTLVTFDVNVETGMCDFCGTGTGTGTGPCLESKSDGTADAINRLITEVQKLGLSIDDLSEILEEANDKL